MKRRAILLLALMGLLWIGATSTIPPLRSPTNPVAGPVEAYYVSRAMDDTATPNLVTAILADYRSYDTFGETTVVFAAGLACFLLLRRFVAVTLQEMITPYNSTVVRTVCKIIIPFAQVFGIYVLFHGHESPGGGFQAGAILGASVILARFTVPREVSLRYLTGSGAIRVGAAGVLLFALTGLLPLLFGGSFLGYGSVPLGGLPPAEVRSLGILVVEIGVAVGVTGVMVSIFDDLAPHPSDSPEASEG